MQSLCVRERGNPMHIPSKTSTLLDKLVGQKDIDHMVVLPICTYNMEIKMAGALSWDLAEFAK